LQKGDGKIEHREDSRKGSKKWEQRGPERSKLVKSAIEFRDITFGKVGPNELKGNPFMRGWDWRSGPEKF